MSKEEFLTIIDRELDRLYDKLSESDNLIKFYNGVDDAQANLEYKKQFFIKARIKRLVEIINLPLYVRIMNITDKEIEEYKKIYIEAFKVASIIADDELNNKQQELESLLESKRNLLDQIKSEQKPEGAEEEYKKIVLKQKELEANIIDARNRQKSCENKIEEIKQTTAETIKQKFLSKINGFKDLGKKLEGDKEDKGLSIDVDSEDKGIELADKLTDYMKSQMDLIAAKEKYYESNLDDDVIVTIPDSLKYLGLESFKYYREYKSAKDGKSFVSEDLVALSKFYKCKEDFESMKEAVKLYTKLIGDLWVNEHMYRRFEDDFSILYDGFIAICSEVSKIDNEYFNSDSFKSNINKIKALYSKLESLQKKNIKTRKIKDQIRSYAFNIVLDITKLYSGIREEAKYRIIELSKEFFPEINPRDDLYDIASINIERIQPLEKDFIEVSRQIQRIEKKRDMHLSEERKNVEQKFIKIEDLAGRKVSTNEVGTFSAVNPWYNAMKIAPIYADTKQRDDINAIKKSTDGSLPEFSDFTLDKLIDERNKLAEEAIKKSKTI